MRRVGEGENSRISKDRRCQPQRRHRGCEDWPQPSPHPIRNWNWCSSKPDSLLPCYTRSPFSVRLWRPDIGAKDAAWRGNQGTGNQGRHRSTTISRFRAVSSVTRSRHLFSEGDFAGGFGMRAPTERASVVLCHPECATQNRYRTNLPCHD